MRSMWMLAVSNLRRHKGAGFALGVLTLIAAALLNLGLLNIAGESRIFNEKRAELHTADIAAVLPDSIGAASQEEIADFIAGYKNVTTTQRETALFFDSASLPVGGEPFSTALAVESTARTQNAVHFVGPRLAETNRSVYLPYILRAKGYKAGDTLKLTVKDRTYAFTVAGFEEDLLWGSTQLGTMRFYLSDGAYRAFRAALQSTASPALLVSARTKTMADASSLSDALLLEESEKLATGRLPRLDINNAKLVVSMSALVGAALEIICAFIVALVVLLMVRFRIASSIEEDMRNIGALEAVGYTGRQLRGAFLLQFLLTALAGGVAGVALSYAAAVPNSTSLSAQTGLQWTQGFDGPVSLLTLLVLLVCVALVALFATARIRRLPVITALRGGIVTHSFRKNPLPLHKTHAPLSLLLGCKAVLTDVRQHLSLGIIFLAVSFASVLIFLLFYNFTMGNRVGMRMMAGEPEDISVLLSQTADAAELAQNIRALPHVTQASPHTVTMVQTDGKISYATVVPDYAMLHSSQVYKGRYPRHENEVAVGGVLAGRLGKGVGDSVRVTFNGVSRTYLITGLTQSMSDLGLNTDFTDAGFELLSPQYRPTMLFIYVADKAHIPGTVRAINARFGAQAASVSNDYATAQSIVGGYAALVAAFAGMMFGIMALVVVLILVLLTQATLVRRRQEFGIQKALGFTTGQLMCQVAFSFVPVGVLGALAGGVLGLSFANPIVGRMFASVGILKTSFVLPAPTVPAVCAVLALLTFGISMLAARRARRISPCALMDDT